MFIGHPAVALASKRLAPRTSLGMLFAAAMLLDLLWPFLLLGGIETVKIDPARNPFLRLDFTSYPISHSLLTACGWGVLFGVAYFAWTRYGRGAVVVGILVVSHWVLDWVTHVPDLPLYPNGPRAGLGLWHSAAGTIMVESALFAAGVLVYVRTTHARDRTGSWAFWSLIAFLVLLYAGSVAGPAPPSVPAIAWSDLGSVILLVWAAWADLHRNVIGPGLSSSTTAGAGHS
jgi:hypothetical protein